jgi:hypothetical protein
VAVLDSLPVDLLPVTVDVEGLDLLKNAQIPESPPSLDELERKHGTEPGELGWSSLKLTLSPAVHRRFLLALKGMPGDDPSARLAALLDLLPC